MHAYAITVGLALSDRTGEPLAELLDGRVALGLANELVALLDVVGLEPLPRQAAENGG